MNEIFSYADSEIVRRIGWTLIHSLWQISIVVGIVSILNLILAKQRSTVRYLLSCVGMLACVAIPIGTLVTFDSASDSVAPNSRLTDSPEDNGFAVKSADVGSDLAEPNRLVVAETTLGKSTLTFASNHTGEQTAPDALSFLKLVSFGLGSCLPAIFWMWIVGVIIVALRPLSGILFSRQLRMQGRSTVPEYVSRMMVEACSQLRIGHVVEITESTLVKIPSVIGCFKPLILLPTTALTGLSESQMRAIIVHELAHIRRHDYLVNLFQTVVESLLFFHPLLWWLSLQIRVERENCCDDVVLEHCDDRNEYVRALIKLESNGERQTIFAMNATAGSLVKRVRRMAGKQNSGVGNTWLAGLIVLVLLALIPLSRSTRLLAAQQETKAESRAIKVIVMNDANEPIKNAKVELRIGDETTSIRTDNAGIVKLDLPDETPERLSIHVSGGEFIPMKAEWDNQDQTETDPIPGEVAFKVVTGIRISGKVIDGRGDPVMGATVKPTLWGSLVSPERVQFDLSELKTDEKGYWFVEHTPAQRGIFEATIKHPDFANDYIGFSSDTTKSHSFVMQVGVMVRGTITDPKGKPLANTQVRLTPKYGTPGSWETRTNEQGVYQFKNVKPDEFTLTAMHKGFAPQAEQIRGAAGEQTLNFRMQPGTLIQFLFVDEFNQPLEGVRVSCTHWRAGTVYGFGEAAPRASDADGNWIWENAPNSKVTYKFEIPGRMSRKFLWLEPSDEPYKYVMHPVLEVSGSVTSKSSGKAISEFTVVTGKWSQPHLKAVKDPKKGGGIVWALHDARSMKNGSYRVRINETQGKHYLKIEAPGYKPAVSRAFNDSEVMLAFDFQLEEGDDNVGRVVNQNGEPIKDAVVLYVLPGRRAEIQDSTYESNGLTDTVSDSEGNFRLPLQDQTYAIMVIADEGFAYILEDDFAKAKQQIEIEPWATIRGTCKIGDKPTAGEKVWMYNTSRVEKLENLHKSFLYWGVLGTDGSYEISRVPPNMPFTIGRLVSSNPKFGGKSGRHTHTKQIEAQPGELMKVDIGNTGRPLIGRFKKPYDASRLANNWNEGTAYLQRASAPGEHIPQYHFNINDDGSFRVEDLPAGDYFLQVFLTNVLAGNDALEVHRIMKNFTIPEIEGDRTSKPFDLGAMELELQK